MADDDQKPAAKRPPRKRPARKSAPTTPAATVEPDETPVPEEEMPSVAVDDGDGEMHALATFTTVVDDSPFDESLTADITASLSTRTLGHLYVHYSARNVSYVMDGGCAARVMAAFAGRADRILTEDEMVPGHSNMNNLWCTVGLDDVLGMSWIPGIPPVGPRTMTVDPPPPAPQ